MDPTERTDLRSVLTVCPYCSCGCGLHLQATREGLAGVSPSVRHPVSQGRLCARGWAAHETTSWGPRIRTPLVRRDGALQPAGWEEALRVAADSLGALRDDGRPLAVLGSGRATCEENFMAAALARHALRTPHIGAGLGDAWDALLGALGERHRPPDLARALTHLEQSELIVAIEGDLVSTHPRLAMAVIRAVRRGGRLVTLGWYPTRLSGLAALHLALRPDAPLPWLAQLRIPLTERTDPGRERAAEAASPDDAPEVRLACWLAESRRTTFLISPFDRDSATLGPTVAGFHDLAKSLAHAGRPEPLVLPLPVRANTRGAHEAGAAPDLLPGMRPVASEGARQRLRALWGAGACCDAGLPLEQALRAAEGLVVVCDDLPAFHSRPAEARELLRRMSALVVLDSLLTETAQAAHVVLPIAGFGETEGTYVNLEGRAQELGVCAAAPPGVEPGWRVLRELIGALGGTYRPASLAAVRADLARVAQLPAGNAVADAHAQVAADGSAPGTLIGQVAEERAPRPANRKLLRRDGVFDWAEDPLVALSPTLRRDGAARARQAPGGQVTMSPEAAAELGVREGWQVRVRSPHGEARAAVTLRPGLDPELLLVPFAARDAAAAVLGADEVAEVELLAT